MSSINVEVFTTVFTQALASALEAAQQPANLEPTQKPETLTPQAATLNPLAFSQATGYGLNRVRDLLHAGKIKHVRSGRRVLIPRAEVEAFLERESSGGEK
jgi:excisionase family DNA binding protein